MSDAYQPELEPMRAPAKPADEKARGGAAVDTQYKYEGKDDDRPLIWREPLNELQGAINELLVKRKKKLGASLSKAENLTPIEDDDQPNISRPRSARAARNAKRPVSRGLASDVRSRDSSRSRERPASRGSARRAVPGSARGSARDLPGSARPYSANANGLGGRGTDEEEDDWEDVDDEELLQDDEEDDFQGPYSGPAEEGGAPREPGGGEDPRLKEARREQLQKAKDEYRAKCREVEQAEASLSSEDVMFKIRKAQSGELQTSLTECDEGAEQAHAWIKALEDVHRKRKAKLTEHDAKLAKAKKAIEESEQALEDLKLERTAAEGKYNRDMALHANTGKVENKTADLWRALEEDIRVEHKQTEEQAGERQREQLRMSKHLQDLVIGEQELQKRLKAQQRAAEEIIEEGKELHKFWRREYLEEEMVVGGAVAEIEAEERARTHLAGHGDRIRAKLESATGNLQAQTAMIEDQSSMDEALKAKTDAVEADMRALQSKLDECEERRAALDRQREEIQQACQDKVEHLNSSLRAIETSANAVATEQVIAQRTLASSEEALETLEPGENRSRLEEDIEALRTSLVSIESRLHEVQKERSAVRETRARTQRSAMEEAAKVTEQIDREDGNAQELLAKRVQLEAEQRQLDGQRVVIHARVKQSMKSVTPLEQEKKLYEAELEWVREFEQHSLMRMQEKQEAKQVLEGDLAELKQKGSQQLKEQTDDEAIIQEGVRAVEELKHKVSWHKTHVEAKLKGVQEALAQNEQDAASLAATMQVSICVRIASECERPQSERALGMCGCACCLCLCVCDERRDAGSGRQDRRGRGSVGGSGREGPYHQERVGKQRPRLEGAPQGVGPKIEKGVPQPGRPRGGARCHQGPSSLFCLRRCICIIRLWASVLVLRRVVCARGNGKHGCHQRATLLLEGDSRVQAGARRGGEIYIEMNGGGGGSRGREEGMRCVVWAAVATGCDGGLRPSGNVHATEWQRS